MPWLAVDTFNRESITENKPEFDGKYWVDFDNKNTVYNLDSFDYESARDTSIYLPSGSIKKLLGYQLTFSDSPIELI